MNGFNSQGLLNEAKKEHEYFLGRKSLKSQLPLPKSLFWLHCYATNPPIFC